jgi:hypothetical protein
VHDRDNEAPVYLVTTAKPGHAQEMSGRMRRYLISMSIRVICLVLAIFVLHGALRLVGVAAAVVLPWIAVVLANAGPTDDGDRPTFVDRAELEPPAVTPIGPSSQGRP